VIIVYAAFPAGAVPATLTAEDDVDLVRWFNAENIPWDDLAFESTRRILERWRDGVL